MVEQNVDGWRQQEANGSINIPGRHFKSNKPHIMSAYLVGILKRHLEWLLRKAHAQVRDQMSMRSHRQRSVCRERPAPCIVMDLTGRYEPTVRLFSGPILWAPTMFTGLYSMTSGVKAAPTYVYLDMSHSAPQS